MIMIASPKFKNIYMDSPIPTMAAKEKISTKWLDSRYINSERTKLF